MDIADAMKKEPLAVEPVKRPLGGWTRLWLVLSVPWLVFGTMMIWHKWPTDTSPWVARDRDAAMAQNGIIGYDPDSGKPVVDYDPNTRRFIPASDEAAAALARSVTKIMQTERAEWGAEWFWLCFFPPACLYAFGWAVFWVRQGFRRAPTPS